MRASTPATPAVMARMSSPWRRGGAVVVLGWVLWSTAEVIIDPATTTVGWVALPVAFAGELLLLVRGARRSVVITADQVISRDWLRTVTFDRALISHVGVAPFEPMRGMVGAHPWLFAPYLVVDGNRYDCLQLRDVRPLAVARAQRMGQVLGCPDIYDVS